MNGSSAVLPRPQQGVIAWAWPQTAVHTSHDEHEPHEPHQGICELFAPGF
jgi:hypothetical protein